MNGPGCCRGCMDLWCCIVTTFFISTKNKQPSLSMHAQKSSCLQLFKNIRWLPTRPPPLPHRKPPPTAMTHSHHEPSSTSQIQPHLHQIRVPRHRIYHLVPRFQLPHRRMRHQSLRSRAAETTARGKWKALGGKIRSQGFKSFLSTQDVQNLLQANKEDLKTANGEQQASRQEEPQEKCKKLERSSERSNG